MKHSRTFAVAALIAIAGSLYAMCPGAPEPKKQPLPPVVEPKIGATFGGRVAWVVALTRAQEGVLLGLQRLIDRVVGGYPEPSYFHAPGLAIDGRRAPAFDALHHTAVRYHPHVLHRCAMPLDPIARAIVITAMNRCANALEAGALPDGGVVPAWCTPLSNLTLVAALPSDWDDVLADAGPAYWFEPDAGLDGEPPSTPDDLSGDTP